MSENNKQKQVSPQNIKDYNKFLYYVLDLILLFITINLILLIFVLGKRIFNFDDYLSQSRIGISGWFLLLIVGIITCFFLSWGFYILNKRIEFSRNEKQYEDKVKE